MMMRIEINEDNSKFFVKCGFKHSWILNIEEFGWNTLNELTCSFEEYGTDPMFITDVRCVDDLKVVNDEFMIVINKVNEKVKQEGLKTDLIIKLSYRVKASRFKFGDFMNLSKTLNGFIRKYRIWPANDYVNKW